MAGAGNSITDSALYLRKTSGQIGDNKASGGYWPTSDAYATYGGAADTWNAGLVDTDIKSTDFGIDLSAYDGQETITAYVDHIQIRIYYTAPSPQTLYPSGISQVIALGTPKLNFILYPSGIAQALAYGTPEITQGKSILPSGIEQLVALGTPTITLMLQFISPTGIAQPIAIGTPALTYPQTLTPQGIAQAVVFGTPSVGVYGFIGPSGIAQLVAIGSPTLLKYVWHVILDGQYIAESPDINRAYVIGRDAYGNPVYGTAVDSTELALVGERLDFIPDPAIPTTAQAGDVASAILAKMRLTGKRGVILIPPNCGQELFDVVQVSDSMANQSAVTFRVVGIRFEYNPKQARYQYRLILGAP